MTPDFHMVPSVGTGYKMRPILLLYHAYGSGGLRPPRLLLMMMVLQISLLLSLTTAYRLDPSPPVVAHALHRLDYPHSDSPRLRGPHRQRAEHVE